MPGPLVSDDEVEQIRQLHADGLSRAAIAKQVKRSPDTVGRICARLGLSFDRSKTEVATAAKRADNRARRADIVARLYAQAERNLTRLERDRHMMAEVSLGKVVRYEVEDLPGADVHRLIGAVGAATSSAVKLEQIDGDGSAEQIGSLLGNLFESLTAKHDAPPADDDG